MVPIHPHQAIALARAFRLATSVASSKADLQRQINSQQHAFAMAELQMSGLKDMVDAVIGRRIDVVEKHCEGILAMYRDQSAAYLAEKEKYTDKILDTTSALKRNQLMSRANDIDTKLSELRADALLLMQRMGELLFTLGGGNMDFAAITCNAMGMPKVTLPTSVPRQQILLSER